MSTNRKHLRIVFAGTPAFGLPCLDALASSSHELIGIYTQPDRPAGRGRAPQPSAVKIWANNHQIPVYQPLHFKDDATVRELAALAPDIMIVIAYGLILPTRILGIPRFGCINVHASILPRWRGASPIQHAILYGDKETGVTIMQMDRGMDTGDMLQQAQCQIEPHETTETLHDKLANIAPGPLLKTLDAMLKGDICREKQVSELATYAPKISKEQAHINWHQPAHIISQQVRAFTPWPIAYTKLENDVIRIHQAKAIEHPIAQQKPGTILSLNKQGMLVSTTENALLIEKIQLPGGKILAIRDYLNGNRHELYEGATFS